MLAALWAVVCALKLALLVATATQGPLLANKCCPNGQQLNEDLNGCVDMLSSDEPLLKSETVAEARRRMPENTNLPPWMDPFISFYIPEKNDYDIGDDFPFLQNAPPNAVLQYGRRPCPFADTQILDEQRDSFEFLGNGTLRLYVKKLISRGSGKTEDVKVDLPPHDWCSDRSPDGTIFVLACPCEKVICVPQCCCSNQHLHVNYKTWGVDAECVLKKSNFFPSFYDGTCLVAGRPFERAAETKTSLNNTPPTSGCAYYKHSATNSPTSTTADANQCGDTSHAVIYTVLENHRPICREGYVTLTLNRDTASSQLRAWLQLNGSAILENFNGSPYDRRDFCLDRITTEGDEDQRMVDSALFCQVKSTESEITAKDYIYVVLFLTGGAFLLLTVVTHALVPMLQRSDHSKALCCHCLALFVASVTMVTGRVGKRLEKKSCRASAFIVQFSFLAAFFWLNVMCFDFAKSFTRMRQNVSRRRRSSHLFLLYSLYAWGSATLVTAITVAIDSLPADAMCDNNPLRPNIGVKDCWFMDKKATLVYYYLPISLVLLTNFVMFGVTVLRIYIVRLGTSILRKKDNSSTTKDNKKIDSQMSSVIVRLFLLMGVTWVTEVLAWWVAPEGLNAFVLMDAVNLLRGVAVFVITCCRRRVWEELRARLSSCGGRAVVAGAAGAERGRRGASGSSYDADRTTSSALSLSEVAPNNMAAN